MLTASALRNLLGRISLLAASSLAFTVSGCAASEEPDDPEPVATTESALNTSFTRTWGQCSVTYYVNQSYTSITQNGHCGYMSIVAACRDSKGTWSISSSAAIGNANPSYIDRTCFTRPHALSWWPTWDHVFSYYTAMVAVDLCAGDNAAACTRFRWRAPNYS